MTKRLSREQVAAVKARVHTVKIVKPTEAVKASTVRRDVFTLLMGKRDDAGAD